MARTHERVRRRTTGRNPNTGQHSVGALTGHLNTDIDARVTSQPSFLGRKAGANTHASRAQETSRECIGGARCGPTANAEKAKRSTGRRTVERHLLSGRSAETIA